MKTPAKILAWTAAALLGVPVVVYLGWLTGNLYDDELDPAVARLLSAEAPAQLDARDNGYFDIIGIEAPDDADAHAWGEARFRQLVATDAPGDAPTARLPARKPAVDAAKIPCVKPEECLAEVAGNAAEAQRVLESEGILLRRLDAALDSRYQEPHRRFAYRSEFASFGPSMTAQKLAQARIALLAAQGRHEEALRQWGRLTAFAARQAAGSCSLLAKMVAVAALHRQHVLLARYMNAYPEAARAHAGIILEMLPPLSRAELALAPALESEIVVMARSFAVDLTDLNRLTGSDEPVPAALAGLLDPFFKPRVTMNELAGQMQQWVALDTLQGGAYRAARARLAERADEQSTLWHYRNPIGKSLAGVAVPDFSSYFYRRDGLEAERRLLRFGLGLIADGKCDPAATKAALADHPELLHPYTGAPPAWNDPRRALSYVVPDGVKGSPGGANFELSFDPACR